MKEKYDIFLKFKEFRDIAKEKVGKKVSCLLTDDRWEHVSHEWRSRTKEPASSGALSKYDTYKTWMA